MRLVSLAEDEKETIRRCYFGGMSRSEIAAKVGRPYRTVNNFIHREFGKRRSAEKQPFSAHKIRLSFEYGEILRAAAIASKVSPHDLLQGLVNDAVADLGGIK